MFVSGKNAYLEVSLYAVSINTLLYYLCSKTVAKYLYCSELIIFIGWKHPQK